MADTPHLFISPNAPLFPSNPIKQSYLGFPTSSPDVDDTYPPAYPSLFPGAPAVPNITNSLSLSCPPQLEKALIFISELAIQFGLSIDITVSWLRLAYGTVVESNQRSQFSSIPSDISNSSFPAFPSPRTPSKHPDALTDRTPAAAEGGQSPHHSSHGSSLPSNPAQRYPLPWADSAQRNISAGFTTSNASLTHTESGSNARIRYYCTDLSCQRSGRENAFLQEASWVRHIKENHEPEEEYKCNNCPPVGAKMYRSKRLFGEHHRKKHCLCKLGRETERHTCPSADSRAVSLPQKQAWGCGYCAQLLQSKNERNRHIGEHYKNDKKTPRDWSNNRTLFGLLRRPDMVGYFHTRNVQNWAMDPWRALPLTEVAKMIHKLEWMPLGAYDHEYCKVLVLGVYSLFDEANPVPPSLRRLGMDPISVRDQTSAPFTPYRIAPNAPDVEAGKIWTTIDDVIELATKPNDVPVEQGINSPGQLAGFSYMVAPAISINSTQISSSLDLGTSQYLPGDILTRYSHLPDNAGSHYSNRSDNVPWPPTPSLSTTSPASRSHNRRQPEQLIYEYRPSAGQGRLPTSTEEAFQVNPTLYQAPQVDLEMT